MSDEAVALPSAIVRACLERTHRGALCRAPPLLDSPYCWWHDQRPGIVVARDKARGKGLQRERVLVHAGEPLPVDLKDEDEFRAFQRGVLRRLLVGAIGPAAARTAIDLARKIVDEERHASRPPGSTAKELMARIMAKPPRWDDDDVAESTTPPAPDAVVHGE